MSPNVQETESVGRKRTLDEFGVDFVKLDNGRDAKTPKPAATTAAGDSLLPPPVQTILHSSPGGSPALTETGSSTPARNSPSPLTPTKSASAKDADGPDGPDGPETMAASSKTTTLKRKRLTAEEKEAKDKELAEKKREREEQAAIKAKEKARQEEEKASRTKERKEKRKQKEEEDRLKAEQRDEKKRKKEEEQRRIQEEKDKKARSQPKLNAFFKTPGTPKKMENNNDSAATSPAKAGSGEPATQHVKSEYERLFKPFFLRENTRLASATTQMDSETREAKSRILDGFFADQRDGVDRGLLQFDPVEALCLPGKPPRRGRIHHPVKHIMETAYREEEALNAAGGVSASDVFQDARKKLEVIPQKLIAFSQDVRPPYYGTVTLKPFALGRDVMMKLARKPMGRRLPLDYDYDSEAEWQEEEGEDLDMEDDEDELDDEDDMDGFLDDAEDAGLSRRVFGNTLEPESSGICYENHHRLGPNRAVYEHKMEFIHEGLEHNVGIDPFSTRYWEPEVKTQPVKAAATASESTTKMPPPPAPANAFAALGSGAANATASAKLVKAELLNDFKQAILDNRALSKVGIIDFIFHQFRNNVSRAEVKNTLEHVAEKKGTGRTKEWDLKPGHEIVL